MVLLNRAVKATLGMVFAGLAVIVCVPAASATPVAGAPAVVRPAAVRAGAGPNPIGPQTFGMHSFWQNPKVPKGAFRLNCAPGWDEIQPINEPDARKWNWAIMDYWVNKVRSWGYRDIIYTFCRTPKWATARGAAARTSSEWALYNPNITDEPPRPGYYRSFVRELIKRYGSAISAYEPINEANMPGFFAGSAAQAADLTVIMHNAVRQYDPRGLVLTASWVVLGSETPQWQQLRLASLDRYLKALRARGSLFNVLALHHYAQNSVAREDIMRRTAAVIAANGYAGKAKWDTEFNLRDNGASATRPTGHYTDSDGAVELVRSYLRGLRQGYARQYWYFWSDSYDSFTGVQMGAGMADSRSNAAIGFQRTFDLLQGSNLLWCTDWAWGKPVFACRFSSPKWAKGFFVAWTRDRTTRGIAMQPRSVWSTYNLAEVGAFNSRSGIIVSPRPRLLAQR